MFTKLDKEVIDLLCCPLCKGHILKGQDAFVCDECVSKYPSTSFPVNDHHEAVYDFRICRPRYCVPGTIQTWREKQAQFERIDEEVQTSDDPNVYLSEIDSVKEIYTAEFHLAGAILDVGGHQGRLRHFLADEEVTYVSVDPWINTFHNIDKRPNLLKVYRCLSKPCNFLACHAESLPFKANSFDWVHMRSVVDHFADPYTAFKEAYRVLRPNGSLMIGLTIIQRSDSVVKSLYGRVVTMLKDVGISYTLKAILRKSVSYARGSDEHTFRFTYDELVDLLYATGFETQKVHWQKPPFTYCVYLSARKARS